MTIILNPTVSFTTTVSMVQINSLNLLPALFSASPQDADIVAEVNYTWLSNAPVDNIIKTNSMQITRTQLSTICTSTSINLATLISNLNTIITAFAQQTGKL